MYRLIKNSSVLFCPVWFLYGSFLLGQAEQAIEQTVSELEKHERIILTSGRKLSATELELAAKIGIQHPQKVRIMVIPSIHAAMDSKIASIWVSWGLAINRAVGLTTGYGIYLQKEVQNNRSILIHELTHVSQYEKAKSKAVFLKQYLDQLKQFGYRNAPMEAEAFRNMNRYD